MKKKSLIYPLTGKVILKKNLQSIDCRFFKVQFFFNIVSINSIIALISVYVIDYAHELERTL